MSGPTSPTTDPAPEPRPLQFTLRSIFVVMTALAVLLGLVMQFGCLKVLVLLVPFVLVVGIAIGIYKRDWRHILSAFGIVFLLLFVVALLMIPVQPARRAICITQLKQIGLALHNYHDRHGSFPPAYVADEDGRPMHSWRVLLLPFINRNDLFEQYRFDEPWNGPNNRKLHDSMPEIFRCPSETSTNMNMTNYVAVVGPATAWPGTRSTKLEDFSDGTDNTILLVEVANAGIHWLEPRDLRMSQMNPKNNGKLVQRISSHHPGVANVLFVDGSVRSLSDNLPPETVKALLTIDGGEEVSLEDW